MLSLSASTLKSLVVSNNHPPPFHKPISISANLSLTPSPYIPAKPKPQQQQKKLYQPFRPPPSPLPSQFASLDTPSRIEVVANRLALWHEYAPLISSLVQEGLSPSSLEEATGISIDEQNRLIVASKVYDSLLQSNADPQIISAFDTGGAELLYEIRLLSATQRASAAKYIILNKLDVKGVQELARAMKDFPCRKGEKGWDRFDYTLPGDCLAFVYYRQSREHRNPSEQRNDALQMSLRVAESERARGTILAELNGVDDAEKEDVTGPSAMHC